MKNYKSLDQERVESAGVAAFLRGDAEEACPYPIGSGTGKRQWWHNGFLSAQSCAKFPRIVTIQEMLAALILLCVVGCGPINVGPSKPNPPHPILRVETIEQSAASSLRLYHERLAAAFETLAQEIEQGGIEDDDDLANRMEELTKTARVGSFEAFRQSWAKHAGADSPWDHKQRASICRETARGFAR